MARYKSYGTRAFSIDIEGFDVINARMRKLPIAVQRRHLRKAMRLGFKVTLRKAKSLVPSQLKKVRRGLKLRKDRVGSRGGRASFRIFTPGPDELGIRPVKRPGSRGGKAKPHYYPMAWETQKGVTGKRHGRSFLRAALRSTNDDIIRVVKNHLIRGIKQEASKK